MIEPDHLPKSTSYDIPGSGMRFTHVNGCLFQLSPTKEFKTMKKGDSLVIKFKAQYFSVARSDLMPNWYLLYPGLKPVLIKSTVGEQLKYVEAFDTPESWKRFDYELENGSMRFDHYNPYSLQERFDRQKCINMQPVHMAVIPTPLKCSINEEQRVILSNGQWGIIADEDLKNEARYLSEKLNIPIDDGADIDHKVTLQLCADIPVDKNYLSDESYMLTINSASDIVIKGKGCPGIFYGSQTLLSIIKDGVVTEGEIVDSPRYSYRGMHIDISRNFHTKEQVRKLIEVMAMYKMNKLHMHLTDDEGWRLEIPGLEELTQIGARRGHVNLSELTSLLPLLGSGPSFDTSGTGYYSVEEYRNILRFAKQHHVEIIPEIDMPGHSHAAVRSMKNRYFKYMEMKEKEKAEEFLLCDLDQVVTKNSQSVDMYFENAMNPGLESTYNFVRKVVTEVKKMHEDISPLRVFHFGGDEVPYESWEGSPACIRLVDSGEVKSMENLMEYFVVKTASIIHKCGLDVAAWQDGVIPDDDSLLPISRQKFENNNVYVYAWQNVWESGLAGCAYRLANADYKVIMCQGTHLYFDHPYEPDPEERGLYWACRFLDSRKVFTFMPDNIYAAADVKLTGEPLPVDYIERNKESHDDLQKPENVIGVQGQLWTELIRTWDQMDSMIFPRLLCLAERAWHKASWEDLKDLNKLKEEQIVDWSRFAHVLGFKELARLDKIGVSYHLSPPGAHCLLEDDKVELNSAYPGLPIFYSTDKGTTWNRYIEWSSIDRVCDEDIYLCVKSADGQRSSRVVVLQKPREK